MTSTATIKPIGPIPHPAPIPQYNPPPPPKNDNRMMRTTMISVETSYVFR
jgi:hypothetical protein